MVTETSQFKTKQGISEDAFLNASQKAQDEFLSKCEGFISRELLKSEDGTWMDIVHFKTMEDAQEAMQKFVGHPSTKAFEEAIDPATAQMRHFEVAMKY